LVRKRHADLEAIMVMLLTEMGMLVFAICTALANLVTDGIVFSHLLHGDFKVSNEAYTAAYATLLCFAVVATALSLGYRIRNARLVKAQLQQLGPPGQPVAASSASAARRQLQQHEWELVQTHRTKVTLSLSLMTVAAQGARSHYDMRACAHKPRGHLPRFADLPMSVLNFCLIFVEGFRADNRVDKTVRAAGHEFGPCGRRSMRTLYRAAGRRVAFGLVGAHGLQAQRAEAPSPIEPAPDGAESGFEAAAAQGRGGSPGHVPRRC
jgi:hypothetical protein